MPTCECFYCIIGAPHPTRDAHQSYSAISNHLLIAESLDPKDSVPMEACNTCGHIRKKLDSPSIPEKRQENK